MSEVQRIGPPPGRDINLAALRLFVGCLAAGASIVLEAWAFSHWPPGAFKDQSEFFRLYCFAVGIASGVAIPRRLWVCPIGVSLGFYVTGLSVSGGNLGFGISFLRRGAVMFGVISFAGALAGALLGIAGRWLLARRHAVV